MFTSIKKVGTVSVLSLGGRLDYLTSASLKTEGARLLADGERRIVIDLAGLASMDSSGLGALLLVARKAVDAGGCVAVSSAPESIMRELEITRIGMILDLFDAEDEAVCALAASPGIGA